MIAALFPGQGSQFPSMGKDLYEQNKEVQNMFHEANQILGFSLTDVMFEGTAEDLKQTSVTQTSVFLHSVADFFVRGVTPEVVAGHSLGEFSALVANESISFEDGMKLVSLRANAMQKSCKEAESGMAAVLGVSDETVIDICEKTKGDVIAANFNCPGQIVISGSKAELETITPILKEAGAKRVLPLPTSGAFHSKFMESAKQVLEEAILKIEIKTPKYPIYQNVTGTKEFSAEIIRKNLQKHLTSPVLWTKTIKNMAKDGVSKISEFGPGKVLQGLVRKIDSSLEIIQ